MRVLLKKGRPLHHDGIWGSSRNLGPGKITLPARFLPDPARKRRSGRADRLAAFRVCGATCDSVDILFQRPFWLPEPSTNRRRIEIGHIGAYSLGLRTHFNASIPTPLWRYHAFEDERARRRSPQ